MNQIQTVINSEATDQSTMANLVVQKQKRKKVLMVHPLVGFEGKFVKHIPLGLLYTSKDLVLNGIEVEVFDCRIFSDTWEEELKKRLDDNILVVGVSVITGKPVENAVEISRFTKKIDPEINVVWGGPFATFYPDNISVINEKSIDYVVSGYGGESFYELVKCLLDSKEPSGIDGIYYRKGEEFIKQPYSKGFEYTNYKDIPYDLIEDYSVYGQLGQDLRIFSMYSVYGCPYKCTFCSSPSQYKGFDKSYEYLSVTEIVDHIQHVIDKYDANYIYFIDDDSFVNLKHVEGIIDEINDRGIKVKLGFRGARINEIKRMDDAFLTKLAGAGTNMMHIGAESGSDRILKLIKKNCTVDDIIECNKKLARHPEITTGFNIMAGLPTESIEEVKATRDLILTLIKDNPNCVIFNINKFIPIAQTELTEFVEKYWGYTPPETMEEWADYYETGKRQANEWDTPKMVKLITMLQFCLKFIDNKFVKLSNPNKNWFYRMIYVANYIYRPIAWLRFRFGIYHGLIELKLYNAIVDSIGEE